MSPTRSLMGVAATSCVALLLMVRSADAQPAKSAATGVVERAIRLLPSRPDVPVRLIDPELAPEPDAIRPLDAFLVLGRDGRPRRVIYLNSRSTMLERAVAGGDLEVAILAAVIDHELAHLRGAGEAEARRHEREFFQRLVLNGQVPPDKGLVYLAALKRHPPPHGLRP